MNKIVAIADNVIIKADEREGDRTSAGGIIIPDTAWEDQVTGRVIAVGPGPRRNHGGDMQCKVGDRVLMKKTIFFPFSLIEDGKKLDYIKVNEDDIVCILKDEE